MRERRAFRPTAFDHLEARLVLTVGVRQFLLTRLLTPQSGFSTGVTTGNNLLSFNNGVSTGEAFLGGLGQPGLSGRNNIGFGATSGLAFNGPLGLAGRSGANSPSFLSNTGLAFGTASSAGLGVLTGQSFLNGLGFAGTAGRRLNSAVSNGTVFNNGVGSAGNSTVINTGFGFVNNATSTQGFTNGGILGNNNAFTSGGITNGVAGNSLLGFIGNNTGVGTTTNSNTASILLPVV
jgi:hypothetical protein